MNDAAASPAVELRAGELRLALRPDLVRRYLDAQAENQPVYAHAAE